MLYFNRKSNEQVDTKIATTRKQYLKRSFKTTLKVIKKEKCRNHNKPIYIGTSILDLHIVLMQDFHYSHIKSKYGDEADILLTDTDSLRYKIETKNVYEDLYTDKKLFNFGKYLKD